MRLFSQNNNNPPDFEELLQQWWDKFLNGNRKRGSGANANGEGDGDDDGRHGGGGGGGGRGGNNGSGNNGSGNNGGGGGGMGIPLPPLPLLSTLLGALLLLGYLFIGFFTVEANERAVMFRLGKPFDVRGPGLKWHMPLIESYRKVNVSEVQRVEIGYRNDTKNKNLRESLMLTGNLNIIDMQFVVQYVLNDPESFLFENRYANVRAEDVVQQVGETAMREVVGRNNIDFVLYEGREAVAEDTKTLMQTILNRYKTGIEVQQVAVQNVQPPDQVQDAFEDAIKARQDRERKINEGEAYANKILPRAQGQASRILKSAEAYKESMIVRAEGEAARFTLLAREYVQAPQVTRRRLYLETVESVMQRARKVIIDDDIGSGNLLYLPLDRMVGGAALAPQLREDDLDGSGGGGGAPQTLEGLKDLLRKGAAGSADALEQRR